MHIQEYLHDLRSELLTMIRASHKALDYSTKGYQLGSLEFCRYARHAEDEVRRLDFSIADRAHTLLHTGQLFDADLQFVSFALRMGKALHITYSVAVQMAETTMLCLERGRTAAYQETQSMGQEVNRLLRLCIV